MRFTLSPGHLFTLSPCPQVLHEVSVMSSSPALPVVAVVGATGAVGAEFMACLEQRNFPMKELRLLASARSKGKTMTFKGQPVTVEELTESSFKGIDIALFSAGAGISRKFGP